MRKPDLEVREVVCSTTGKPMAKIPLWMSDVNVKFVSEESKQKSSAAPSMLHGEQIRPAKVISAQGDDLKGIDSVETLLDDPDSEFEDVDVDLSEAEDVEEEAVAL